MDLSRRLPHDRVPGSPSEWAIQGTVRKDIRMENTGILLPHLGRGMPSFPLYFIG